MTITFAQLRIANMARVGLFKGNAGQPAHSEPDGSDWSPNDWFTAAAGELGELGNLLKKLRRGDFQLDETISEFRDPSAASKYMTYREWIASELAGTIVYLDLLARRLEIETDRAVMDEFNRVSDRIGVDIQLRWVGPHAAHNHIRFEDALMDLIDEYRGDGDTPDEIMSVLELRLAAMSEDGV